MSIMQLWNDVLDHEKHFNEYLHFLGAGDGARAAEAAQALLKGITATLDNIRDEYPTLFIEAHLSDYWETRKKFEGPTPSDRELAALASKLENYVSVMEGEVQRLRRKEPPKWAVFLFHYRKRIAVALGVVVGSILLSWTTVRFLHRGQGLTAEYYNDMELGVFYKSRIDRTIDFSWGRGSPFPGWRKDHFSVRWSGFLRLPEAGHYEIYVHVDDGARLTLDDKLLIDDWSVHKLHVIPTVGEFEAGYHPIRLDYFERSKLSTIRLYWKTATSPRPVPIPGRFLVPSDIFIEEGAKVFGKAGEPEVEVEEADEPEEPSAKS